MPEPTETVTVTAAHVEAALRGWLAHFDYDAHKYTECGEDDGADHYPEEAADLFAGLRGAAASAPAPVLPMTAAELAAGSADVAALNAEFPDEPQDPTGSPALTDTERSFLLHALELAADAMAHNPDDYTPDDDAAIARLHKLAGEAS